MPLDTKFGVPLQPPRSDSLDSILILEPVLGLDVAHPSVNAKPGATPYSENYIIRDGALEPRPMLAVRGTNQQPVNIILGGAEVVNVAGTRYPLVSGTTIPAFYNGTTWSTISYVQAYGLNDIPLATNVQYADITQIYDTAAAENLAVWANGSYQSLYCWAANSVRFSTLSGAPPALYVTAFNDYLVAFNLNTLVQRVQWNDRGSNSSWTGGLSGFADLLDMRGQGTRVMSQENRLVLFSEYEVWQGVPAAFPFIFSFDPIDRAVGCPYSWTAANTPAGIMFLSNDYNVYLISKWGGPARSVGDAVQKYLRDNIDQPTRAWAVYDRTYNQYQLYFPVKGGSGRPQQALFLNVGKIQYSPLIVQVGEGSWALQTFDKLAGNLSLTRGFEAQVGSGATTWANLNSASIRWDRINMTWAQLSGANANAARAVHIGSSNGTMYYYSSAATSDNGTAVRSIWRSSALFGFQPNRQKTMGRIRIDYQADSASTLSVEASRNQGASFEPAVALSFPANSAMSEGVTHLYAAARYPMFQVSSEAQRYRLFRFWLNVRAGGR